MSYRCPLRVDLVGTATQEDSTSSFAYYGMCLTERDLPAVSATGEKRKQSHRTDPVFKRGNISATPSLASVIMHILSVNIDISIYRAENSCLSSDIGYR